MSLWIQANTNGRLHDAREASLAPLDRGFLYGDAIYEVWRTYDGALFAFDEHWKRLERSAAALHVTLPFAPEELIQQIRRTTAAYRERSGDAGELYIRLQLTRGAGAIGLDIALAERPTFVLLVQKLALPTPEKLAAGMKLSVARSLRRNPVDALNPAWKTGNYLNNLLCLREAKARGADEVVMINHAGQITEAAVCNLFFVRGGRLLTPPSSAGILEGITRALLLEKIAPAAGVPAGEVPLGLADLESVEESFLTSTTRDVVPISQIDEHRFSLAPDGVWRRLKDAFAAYASRAARQAPAAHRL